MKSYTMRLVLGVVLALLLTPASSFATPLNQGAPTYTAPANHKEISGDPLRIQVGENGSIQVYHTKTGSKGAAYGSADSGFFLAIGSDIYSPNLHDTNVKSAVGTTTKSLTLNSHEGPTGSGSASDPFKVVTNQTLDGSGAKLGMVQTVSYVNGKNNFRQDWDITNNGSSETCFNAYHAADIYFAGSDTGSGYYNAETGSVGGQGQDNAGNDWFMVFSPVTPADHYQEGHFNTDVWETVKTGGDLKDSIDSNIVDNGIALQWNKCVQPGESTTISDLWSFGEDDKDIISNTRTQQKPDLSVTIAGSAKKVVETQEITYTATVKYTGSVDATNAKVTITLPAGLTFERSDDCTEDANGAFTCTVGTLKPGELKHVSLIAKPNTGAAGQNLDITAEVSSDLNNEEENLANNKAAERTDFTICSSCGDVHIFTYDGLIYDFQATGDFLALYSGDGKVIVQARQESWEKKAGVSVNTALALSLDGRILEFYVKPEPSFYNNGTSEELPTEVLTFAEGGSIHRIGTNESRREYVIHWPDDSFKVWLIMHKNSHLDYGFSRNVDAQIYEGLLGNLDGNAQNDMQINNGDMSIENEVIKPPASFDDLDRFGDSWRIPEGASLFRMGEATDTEAQPLTMQNLGKYERANADAVCRDNGITDQTALRNCVYDVAATGDDTFVESAKLVQDTTQNLPPSAKVPAQPGETLGGEIFDANQALTIMDGDDIVITAGKTADGMSYLRYNIYRGGEYIASFSVGTDANVADAVSEAIAPTTVPEVVTPEVVTPEVVTPGVSDDNLALSYDVTEATSEESEELVSDFAFDGDSETRWSSDYEDPQWVGLDLGGVYNINRVVLNWEAAYAAAYEIQVSFDAASWETIYSTSEGAGGIEELTDLSGTGQYVRMLGTERGTEWGYSLWEFEVYGSLSND